MIINNNFAKDDDSDRAERLELLSANIDKYALEIGVSGDNLIWAQNASAQWEDIRASAGVERGEQISFYSEYHAALNDASKYYATAKKILKTMIKQHGGNIGEIVHAYGLEGKSPRNLKGLLAGIKIWKDTNDELVSESDPRVLPQNIMDSLVQHRDNINEMWHKALNEKEQASEAKRIRRDTFASDSKRMTLIFTLCIIKWGREDHRLELLGFKTKSGTWTPKKKDEENDLQTENNE